MLISLLGPLAHFLFPFSLPAIHFMIPDYAFQLPFMAYLVGMGLSNKVATLLKSAH